MQTIRVQQYGTTRRLDGTNERQRPSGSTRHGTPGTAARLSDAVSHDAGIRMTGTGPPWRICFKAEMPLRSGNRTSPMTRSGSYSRHPFTSDHPPATARTSCPSSPNQDWIFPEPYRRRRPVVF
jgi:hypothetical protein